MVGVRPHKGLFSLFASILSRMSIFEKEFEGFPDYPELKEDIDVSVAVVGGGIAGLLAAYWLSTDGKKVALFEARRVCRGTTARTTAAVTALQGLFYAGRNRETAADYLASQIEAVRLYEEIIAEYNISCDWEAAPAYLYAGSKKEEKKLQKEYKAMKSLNAPAEWSVAPQANAPAIRMDNQGQFNPLKFLAGLPKKFDIYENTRITDIIIKEKTLKTQSGKKIKADKIVFATRFPVVIDGAFYFKMYQAKSYVTAFRHKPLGATYNGTIEDALYFRSYGDKVLLGGFDHRTGYHKNKVNYYEKLKKAAKELFGAEEKDFVSDWSAEDAVTFDTVPFAGRVSKKKKHRDVFVLGGFNEWGMASAMICAKTVAEEVAGSVAKYQKLFCPSRPYYFKNFGKFLRHGGVAAVHLTAGLFKGRHSCRHIHCSMKYNKLENVWECPCHGSRYDADGNLLDGPAAKSL